MSARLGDGMVGGRDGESANLVAERSRRREEGALRREALAAVIGGGSSWEGVEDGACGGGGIRGLTRRG